MKYLTSIILSCCLVGIAFAQPAEEKLIGQVSIKKSGLDSKARNSLSVIAGKIKKLRKSGAVRIVGSSTDRSSQDAFITSSIFIARSCENYLRTLLPKSFQIHISASKYEENESVGNSAVTVFLYPHELKVQGARFVSSEISQEEPVYTPSANASDKPVTVNRESKDSSLLSKPVQIETPPQNVFSKEDLRVQEEDPQAADELVNKAKARALKRAKQLENQ